MGSEEAVGSRLGYGWVVRCTHNDDNDNEEASSVTETKFANCAFWIAHEQQAFHDGSPADGEYERRCRGWQ